jgi:hypothetical protein
MVTPDGCLPGSDESPAARPPASQPSAQSADGSHVQQLGVAPLADLSGEGRRRIDSLLNRWLIVVRNHPLGVHLFVAVLLIALANAFFLATRSPVPALLASVGLELIIITISLAIPVALTVAALRREFVAIFSLVSSGPAPAAPVLLRFVAEQLDELDESVGDLRINGAMIGQGQVADWLRRRCFAVTSGRYLATDTRVPSEFVTTYDVLLQAHSEYLERTHRSDSVRINVSSTEDLVADRESHPDAFASYVQWHKDHRVTLLHLDNDDALRLAERCRVDTTDWSLWLGEIVIEWKYLPAGLQLRLGFVGELLYRRCYNLIRAAFEDERTALFSVRFPVPGSPVDSTVVPESKYSQPS